MTDKEKRKAKLNLSMIHKRILAAFSFKEIKTWTDLYKRLGYTELKPEWDKPITFGEVKEVLEKQTKELEEKLNGQDIPAVPQVEVKGPVTEPVSQSPVVERPSGEERVEALQQTIDSSEGSSTPVIGPDTRQSVEEAVKVSSRTKIETEIEHGAKDNYGLIKSPHEKAILFWHQKKCVAEMLKKVVVEKRTGVLLLAPTGVGKTFDIAGFLRRCLDMNYHEGKTYSHIPYLYITKSTILEQTGRVFNNLFNIKPNVDVEIINIESLRASAGQLWIKEEVYVEDGNEKHRFVWKSNPRIPMHPCIVAVDESQGTKNKWSKQSRIIYRYNDLPPDNRCLICISATPFTRVSEAQAFAVSTNRPIDHLGYPVGTRLTNETWPTYAAMIAAPSKPEEYNEAAVKRLMDDLEPWIVRVRGVKPQFSAINGVKIIDFETPELRAFYNDAWERFLKEKAKIDAAAEAGDSTGTCYLVELLKFAMAAEFCHASHFARDMDKAVREKGKAAVAAVKFKQTLIEIVRLLITKYGWTRDMISLVWGGGQTQLTKKQKVKAKMKDMADKFKQMGIEVDELMSDTGLDEVEDRVIVKYPEEWKLGAQDQDERQTEIDRFQSGKSLFCIYTLKSGGVGLSLHHTDELTTFKCRRKESGYVVEEDVPKVPVRERETFIVVTYNAIELVQGVGRVPRLTSLTPTVQNVYCYAGTVEVDMGRIYSQKLRCLSSVVKQREDWQDVIFSGKNRQKLVEDKLAQDADKPQDESTLVDEGDSGEDDGENGNGKEE